VGCLVVALGDLFERQGVMAEVWAVPPSGEASSHAGAVPDRHLRQVPNVLRTGMAVCPRLARPQSSEVGDRGVGASFGPFRVAGQGRTTRRRRPIAICCGDGILAHPQGAHVSSAAAGAWADGRRLDANETGLGLSVPVSRSSGTT
jgi:hypothetical protein